jgi:hypothetical protein
MVVPSSNPFDAIAQVAAQLASTEVIMGRSAVMSARDQALRLGEAWEKLPQEPRLRVRLRIFESGGVVHDFALGAHAPELSAEDVERIHRLWLELKGEVRRAPLRHRDIVTVAVNRLAKDLDGPRRAEVLRELARLERGHEKPGKDRS